MSEENKPEEKKSEEEKKPGRYDHYKFDKDGNKLKSNPELLNGPISENNRKCTDVIFCLIFICFILALLGCGAYGWWFGNPDKVLYFYDDDGKQCGLGFLTNYPYVYMYNTVTRLEEGGIDTFTGETFCVKACPTNYLEPVICKPTKKKTDCLVKFKNLYLSEPFLNRICLPSFSAYSKVDTKDSTQINPFLYPEGVTAALITTNAKSSTSAKSVFNTDFINTNEIMQYVADLGITWPAIAGSVGAAFIIALIYMIFLRCCAGFICWCVIFLILIVLTVIGYIFQARTLLYTSLAQKNSYIACRVFSCIFYTLACIWLIFILANCNNIRLAIALIKTTAHYIGSEFCVMFVPLVMTGTFICFMIYWIITTLYIYSSGSVVKETNSFYAVPEWTDTVRYIFWFNLFGMLWILSFIEAYNLFVLVSSACLWYFEHNNESSGGKGASKIINRSFFRGIRFHLGSLAFGSLIVAIIRFAIIICEYIKKQIELTSGTGAQSEFYKCLITACECCLACCLKCVEFINKHAYIQVI